MENWKRFLSEGLEFKGVLKYSLGKAPPLAGVDQDAIQNKAQRDGESNYHITIIDSKEAREIMKKIKQDEGLSNKLAKDRLKKIFANAEADLNKAKFSQGTVNSVEGPGDGSVGVKDQPSKAFYIPVAWPDAQKLRDQFDLGPKDFHITVGIGENGDVHGVEKK